METIPIVVAGGHLAMAVYLEGEARGRNVRGGGRAIYFFSSSDISSGLLQ